MPQWTPHPEVYRKTYDFKMVPHAIYKLCILQRVPMVKFHMVLGNLKIYSALTVYSVYDNLLTKQVKKTQRPFYCGS